MRVAPKIMVTDEQRKVLGGWARGHRTPVRLMQRAKIVLLAADGKGNWQIASELQMDPGKVCRWRKRFAKDGLGGIEKDLPRGGRPPTIRTAMARKIVDRTTQSVPSNATHWSTRTMAEAIGTTQSMVSRVWRANNLKPHLSRGFKLSNDPRFVEKLIDVVGLYLNPPEHALVLCCDEKSQIQALDRTQPGLPIKKGRCGTMTHDYKRNGTTTLFAALEVADGKLIGTCMQRHRHQEWLKFLKLIDAQTPQGLDLHLIADNYHTHKHEKVQRWLAKHPRFHMHFIPTSSSWLNLVERWFREITDKRIRRGVFKSVDRLIAVIMSYIDHHNQDPTAFMWTAKAEDILAKVRRARAILNKVQTD
jgi:transposase